MLVVSLGVSWFAPTEDLLSTAVASQVVRPQWLQQCVLRRCQLVQDVSWVVKPSDLPAPRSNAVLVSQRHRATEGTSSYLQCLFPSE